MWTQLNALKKEALDRAAAISAKGLRALDDIDDLIDNRIDSGALGPVLKRVGIDADKAKNSDDEGDDGWTVQRAQNGHDDEGNGHGDEDDVWVKDHDSDGNDDDDDARPDAAESERRFEAKLLDVETAAAERVRFAESAAAERVRLAETAAKRDRAASDRARRALEEATAMAKQRGENADSLRRQLDEAQSQGSAQQALLQEVEALRASALKDGGAEARAALVEDNEALVLSFASAAADRDAARGKLDGLIGKYRKLETKVEAAKERFATDKASIATLEQTVLDLRDIAAQSDAGQVVFGQEGEELERVQLELTKATDAATALQAQLDTQAKMLDDVSKRNDKLTAEAALDGAAAPVDSDEVARFKAAAASLEAANEAKARALDDASAQNEQLSAEKEQLWAQNEELSRQNQGLAEDLEAKASEASRVAQDDGELARLQSALLEATETAESLESKLAAKARSLEDLFSENDRLAGETEAQAGDLAKAHGLNSDLLQRLEAAVAAAGTDAGGEAVIRAELEAAKGDHAALEAALEQKLAAAQQRTADVEAALVERDEIAEASARRLADLSAKSEDQAYALAEAQGAHAARGDELEEARALHAVLSEEFAATREAHAEELLAAREAAGRCDDGAEAARSAEAKSAAERSALEAQLESARKDASDADASAAEASRAFETTVLDLENKVEASRSQIETVESQLRFASASSASAAAAVVKLEQKLAVALQTAGDLDGANARLRKAAQQRAAAFETELKRRLAEAEERLVAEHRTAESGFAAAAKAASNLRDEVELELHEAKSQCEDARRDADALRRAQSSFQGAVSAEEHARVVSNLFKVQALVSAATLRAEESDRCAFEAAESAKRHAQRSGAALKQLTDKSEVLRRDAERRAGDLDVDLSAEKRMAADLRAEHLEVKNQVLKITTAERQATAQAAALETALSAARSEAATQASLLEQQRSRLDKREALSAATRRSEMDAQARQLESDSRKRETGAVEAHRAEVDALTLWWRKEVQTLTVKLSDQEIKFKKQVEIQGRCTSELQRFAAAAEERAKQALALASKATSAREADSNVEKKLAREVALRQAAERERDSAVAVANAPDAKLLNAERTARAAAERDRDAAVAVAEAKTLALDAAKARLHEALAQKDASPKSTKHRVRNPKAGADEADGFVVLDGADDDVEGGNFQDGKEPRKISGLAAVWSRVRRTCPRALVVMGDTPPTINVRTVGVFVYLVYLQLDVFVLRSHCAGLLR
mmetsp:Transcript_2209/g.7897  ORF Transcript_2209/g.7897 Transcript_2209/m.7897 type:complete len:1251 (-) Transcript_2209:63-3815(-)